MKRLREESEIPNKRKKLLEDAAASTLLKAIFGPIEKMGLEDFDEDLIRTCIGAGADINVLVNGTPIWHHIVWEIGKLVESPENSYSIAKLFIEEGVDVLAIDREGNNFFHVLPWATPEAIDLLADINEEVTQAGLTVTNHALLLPWENYLEDVLRDCAPNEYISIEDFNIADRLVAINQLMPKKISDISVANINKFKELSMVMKEEKDYPPILKLLAYALRNNLEQIIAYHQKANSDLNKVCDNEGNTLLDLANKNGDHDLVIALVKLGAKNIGDKMHRTSSYRDVGFLFFANEECNIKTGHEHPSQSISMEL